MKAANSPSDIRSRPVPAVPGPARDVYQLQKFLVPPHPLTVSVSRNSEHFTTFAHALPLARNVLPPSQKAFPCLITGSESSTSRRKPRGVHWLMLGAWGLRTFCGLNCSWPEVLLDSGPPIPPPGRPQVPRPLPQVPEHQPQPKHTVHTQNAYDPMNK